MPIKNFTISISLLFLSALFLSSLFLSASSSASTAFISGAPSYFYHSGPSTKYRITGKVHREQPVNIIDTTNSHRFYKIQLADNSTGWIDRRYVTLGQNNQTQVQTLRQHLADSIALINKQADEIHRLKMQVNTQKIYNAQYTSKQSELTDKIYQLNNQMIQLDDSNLIRWITHISTVSLLAFAVIYFINSRRKRRNYL